PRRRTCPAGTNCQTCSPAPGTSERQRKQKRPRMRGTFHALAVRSPVAGTRRRGGLRNCVLFGRAELVQRLVVAPVGVEAVVALQAFVNCPSQFFRPLAILALQEKALTPVGGRAFRQGNACGQRATGSDG